MGEIMGEESEERASGEEESQKFQTSDQIQGNKKETGDFLTGCFLLLAAPLAITWWFNGASWWNWLLVPLLILAVASIWFGETPSERFKTSFGALVILGGGLYLLINHSPDSQNPPVPSEKQMERERFMNECTAAAETIGANKDVAYQDCLATWNELP